jgi:hypothetical protein
MIRLSRTAEGWNIGLHGSTIRAEERFSRRIVTGHVISEDPSVVELRGEHVPPHVVCAARELVSRRVRMYGVTA